MYLVSINPMEDHMPRTKTPQVCLCGCGQMTAGGRYRPSHDADVLRTISDAVGGIAGIREIVEARLGRKLTVENRRP